MMNVDVDWSLSLDGENAWELFGGETIRFDCVSDDCDSGAWHADNFEDPNWQSLDDDVLSVCSSATCCQSCLRSNDPHKTCLEKYCDQCNLDADQKFDRLLSNRLISNIMSCMDDNLSVSSKRFHEINQRADSAVKIESDDTVDSLLLNDVIEVLVAHDDADLKTAVNAVPLSEIGPDAGTSQSSPDSGVTSLECEELYEESVTRLDFIRSTLSREEWQDLTANSRGNSDAMLLAKHRHRHPVTELKNSCQLKKKEQNKTAAVRYRLKKRSEQGLMMMEYSLLERRNIELRTRLDSMTKEISYLKTLIDELCE